MPETSASPEATLSQDRQPFISPDVRAKQVEQEKAQMFRGNMEGVVQGTTLL
jgi:hypothetical protein